jgi:hypothetical protein
MISFWQMTCLWLAGTALIGLALSRRAKYRRPILVPLGVSWAASVTAAAYFHRGPYANAFAILALALLVSMATIAMQKRAP